MKISYKARATATGGRAGHVRSDDGALSVDLARPDSGRKQTNPEQLFAAAYAVSFDSALQAAALSLKLVARDTQTSMEVGIGQNAAGGYTLDVDIFVVTRGLPEDQARRLIEAADLLCPYSSAVRGNVDVRLHVATS